MLERLTHYNILGRIGAGGMGDVYRARDTRLGRTVAIKLLSGEDDVARRERLLREARTAAALSHPNITALYEIGEDEGRTFLVFEFVPGDPLSRVIGGRALNPRRALHFGMQIADALADAHAAGVVHRDIKPDNIIITPKGNAKILDFGLATWTAGGAARDLAPTMFETGAGVAMGTIAYMSPEQALGQAVDYRTDIFSLGILLFEMLTGTLPFNGATPAARALQIVRAPAPAPSSVNPAVPRELDAILEKTLAKNAADRWESAATLAAELRAVDAALEGRARHVDHAPTAIVAAPRAASRAPWIVVSILLAVVAVAVWYERTPLLRLWYRVVAPAPSPVIAVMPLELADSDPSRTYFADGLTEDLITRLGQTAGVKVIGRSAVRDYRGRSPRDLARELGAGVVLTGTVRPAGDTVKISLELVDPADNIDVWTGQYTRETKDIFAVQAQVASDVARALRLTLQPTAASERTASRQVDARAYDAYLRGRQAAAQRDLREAKRLFLQAIQLDPGLPEAHAGLAEALQLESVLLGAPDDPARTAALKRAAARAYELDPDLPQANLAAAIAADRLSDALGFLKKSIAIDPTFSEGFNQIGDHIQDFDPVRSIAFYRRALAIDPRMDINHADIVGALSALGRYPEAQRELDAASDSSGWKTPLRLALALDQRRYEEALAGMRDSALMEEAAIFKVGYVSTLQMAGHRDEAQKQAEQLVRSHPELCEARAALAGIRQERGQRRAARELVEPALQAGAAADVGPATLRCAALSAAAVSDVPAAAQMIRRIASDGRLLRAWALEITGTTGGKLLRRAMFPWNHVFSAPEFVDARRALDAAYASERRRIAGILDDVTP